MAGERTELMIPLDNFIYRIAWYQFRGKQEAAVGLRLLALECHPPYEVDEELVREKLADLKQRFGDSASQSA